MDKNTKIGFAVVGVCLLNLASSVALNKKYLVMASKQHKTLVDAHNKLVTDLRFAQMVRDFDR